MKRTLTKILTNLLTGILSISCSQIVDSNHSDKDQQLFKKKYQLSKEEIEFIEEKVQAMD